MNELINRIEASNHFYSMNGAEPSLIKKAEIDLSLILAQDYKDYVMTFGVASFEGHELTGICDSERLSVVSATERARELYPKFPRNMYVVEDLHYDHIFIVQDLTGSVYSYGPVDEAKYIAKSLLDYLFPQAM